MKIFKSIWFWVAVVAIVAVGSYVIYTKYYNTDDAADNAPANPGSIPITPAPAGGGSAAINTINGQASDINVSQLS